VAVVGVVPPDALRERPRLFRALADVFDVRFEGRDDGSWAGLDAVVLMGMPRSHEDAQIPRLEYSFTGARPTDTAVLSSVELGSSDRVDFRLRDRCLVESGLAGIKERLTGDTCLARDRVGLLWTMDSRRPNLEIAVLAPPELELGEPLRAQLHGGRFIGLLPLLHLLRRVTGYEAWRRPPPRATFVVDDPNLHWPSYGYIDFAELERHARHHGYHVAMGVVPLDCWLTHAGAARTFRDARTRLSLTLHGNDHIYSELAFALELDDAVPIFDQAMRRVSHFQARTGLGVDRVMIPPHGLCADEMLDAMLVPGIEALCRAPSWWNGWAPERRARARWTMADVSPSGAPILGRHLFTQAHALEEVALDLFLDQPAILYGHHYDFVDGYDLLAVAAEWLNRLEGLTWQSCGHLARTNLMTRREGSLLRVRPYTRRGRVELEHGVNAVEFEMPAYDEASSDMLVCGEEALEIEPDGSRTRVFVRPESETQTLEFRLVRRRAGRVRRRRSPARAVVRRGVAEFRDRVHPLVHSAGLGATLSWLEGAYLRRASTRTKRNRRTSL
jgi:hypothetical protein